VANRIASFPFHAFRQLSKRNFDASATDIESSSVATQCACCLLLVPYSRAILNHITESADANFRNSTVAAGEN